MQISLFPLTAITMNMNGSICRDLGRMWRQKRGREEICINEEGNWIIVVNYNEQEDKGPIDLRRQGQWKWAMEIEKLNSFDLKFEQNSQNVPRRKSCTNPPPNLTKCSKETNNYLTRTSPLRLWFYDPLTCVASPQVKIYSSLQWSESSSGSSSTDTTKLWGLGETTTAWGIESSPWCSRCQS